jgi:hypothetical protein
MRRAAPEFEAVAMGAVTMNKLYIEQESVSHYRVTDTAGFSQIDTPDICECAWERSLF